MGATPSFILMKQIDKKHTRDKQTNKKQRIWSKYACVSNFIKLVHI